MRVSGEFSGGSRDPAVHPVTDEDLLTSSAEPFPALNKHIL